MNSLTDHYKNIAMNIMNAFEKWVTEDVGKYKSNVEMIDAAAAEIGLRIFTEHDCAYPDSIHSTVTNHRHAG